jgi:hypothetical protein
VPIDTDVYARIIAALGTEPMDGLLVHLCVRKPGGGLQYIDVWESEEQCARAFDERAPRRGCPQLTPGLSGTRRSGTLGP